MEFSTLGGWIATRASGMKRATYGNIEDMLIRVRVATPSGTMEENMLGGAVHDRVSTGMSLASMVLGSEGCLGVITSAVLRIHRIGIARHESVVFPGV
jgi:alkyldihydroxyacetonephosphate synthase